MKRRKRFLALLALGRFHHAAHAEQRVEPRMLQPGQVPGAFCHGLRLTERGLVQPNLRAPGLAPDPKIDGAIAARELLLGEAPRPDFERLETGGETQAEVERAAVDATRFPSPAGMPVHTVTTGKTSHALQCHGLKPPSLTPHYAAYKPSRIR